MKTTALYLVMIMAAMTTHTLSGQGTKQEVATTETRQIDGFHSVNIAGLAEVYLREGPPSDVKVVVSGMPVTDVVVTTADSVLNICTKGSHNGESVKAYVNYVTLRSVAVADAAILSGESIIKTDRLSISVTDAGDATLAVDVNNLTVALEEAGNLTITGKANVQEIRSVGEDGTLDDRGLKVKVENRD